MASLNVSSKYLKFQVGKDVATVTVDKSAPPSTYGPAFDGELFQKIASTLSVSTAIFDIDSAETIRKAVNECPQVGTIVFRRAGNQANGITAITTTEGKPLRGPKGAAWQRVIDKPNYLQTRAQFTQLRDIFLFTTGWCFEYKIIPDGFGPEYVQRRILNPQYTEITWHQRSLFGVTDPITELVKEFYYTENGVRSQILDLENLYFYVNPNILSRSEGFLPESPLKTLKYPINNSIINYKARNRMVKGPFGLITPKAKDDISSMPLLPKDKEAIQTSLRNYGSEFDDQSQYVIPDVELGFTPLMYPIKDLQLLELLKSDSAAICDRMGYEYDLLARDLGGVALNNKGEAGKNQYQNHEIPWAKLMDQQEMESLGAESNGFKIVTSFEHLPVLQEDKKLSSEVLRNNVQSYIQAFKSNQCGYADMVTNVNACMGVVTAKPYPAFANKFWAELTPEEQALFSNQNFNANDTNNQNANGGGNQAGNQGQGANNQN